MQRIVGQHRIKLRLSWKDFGDDIESSRLAILERLEEHAVDDRKNGGVGADTETERQYRNGRETAIARQGPDGVPYVT